MPAIILLAVFSITYFQSCEQDFVATPENVASFPAEVYDVFNTPYTANNLSCTTPFCHSNENSAAGLNLVDWNKTMSGSNSGTMIIPYNGFWSHLIAYTNSDTNFAPVTYIDSANVLYTYHKIEARKDSILMKWINDGAKSNTGQVAFSDLSNSLKGFITNQAADVVAVLQTESKLVTRLVPVGINNTLESPHYITIEPSNQYFFVSLIKGGFIEKFSVSNYEKVARMQGGEAPAHIIISSDGQKGYFSNFTSTLSGSNVTRFDPNSMTVTGVLSNPRFTGAHGLALTENGQTLYAVSEFGEYLFMINTNTFEVENEQPIDPSVPPGGTGTGNFTPYQVVLSPDESLLYVSCLKSNQVRVYNSATLAQVNAIGVGKNPLLMKFTNDGNYLVVCNRNDSSVSVINAQTQSIHTTILDAGVQPHGVDITADGKYAIIACETQAGYDGHHPQVGSTKVGVSRIIQINGSEFTLLPNKLEMGSFPAGVAAVR